MRLWPYQMLDVLPYRQLISQWRECLAVSGMIASGKLNHSIIKRVNDYPIEHFAAYCDLVREEFKIRGYVIGEKTIDKLDRDIGYSNLDYEISRPKCSLYSLAKVKVDGVPLFDKFHNERYVRQCMYSFQEKFDCGMITENQWKDLEEKFSFLM